MRQWRAGAAAHRVALMCPHRRCWLWDDGSGGRLAPAAASMIVCKDLAWAGLRQHVLSGCLCDPIGVDMNAYGKGVKVGGEWFRQIRTLRGASALEGFHNHQKQWLGCLARHAADAGSALLADGAVRWNRKRHRSSDVDQACTEDSE